MKIGKVIGYVQTVRQVPCLQGQKFLVVKFGEDEFIAADQVDARPGDHILFTAGSTAARYCMDAPIDVVAVAVVDGMQER